MGQKNVLQKSTSYAILTSAQIAAYLTVRSKGLLGPSDVYMYTHVITVVTGEFVYPQPHP